jgi:hypothetical protein
MKRNSLNINSQHKFKINARVMSTKLKINNGILSSNYILYVIKVNTPYKSWYIQKRYSDFENLNNSIPKDYEIDKLIPPKRLFKNSDSTIQERKKKFNNYLYFLLNNLDVLKNKELIKFFKIDEEIIDLYLINSSMISNEYALKQNNFLCQSFKKNNLSNSLKLNEDNYFILFEDFHTSSEELKDKTQIGKLVIEEFLKNLDLKIENMDKIVKTFLSYMRYNNKWKKLYKEEIKELFIGANIKNNSNDDTIINYSNQETQKSTLNSDSSFIIDNYESMNPSYVRGLFFHIGNYYKNYLGSVSCLNLLYDLLNIEKNPDAENYIKIFKNCKIQYFELMKLIELSKIKNYSNEKICFDIIRIYFNIINDDLEYINIKYGIDKQFIYRFENWIKNQFLNN